jgi:imidazole glycerol-phosphate synthase subunit HisH
MTVAIIDYGMGNLYSVQRACEHLGVEAAITGSADVLLSAEAAILPGVGAFGDAMGNLKERGLAGPIKEFIASGRPFMGICLGLQLLMSESEEFGVHEGLNIFAGKVVKFPAGPGIKVPQVGWNKIKRAPAGAGWEASLLRGVREEEFMYFVHSFYVVPAGGEAVLSVSSYEGVNYCSSLQRGNVFACQFHPEKSAGRGLKIYQNFAGLIEGRKK